MKNVLEIPKIPVVDILQKRKADLEASFMLVDSKMLDKFFAEKLYVLGATTVDLALEHINKTCKTEKTVSFIQKEFDEFVDITTRKEKFRKAAREAVEAYKEK